MSDHAADLFDQLERYRAYLALLVRLQLDERLQGKADLSGVVQPPRFDAYQGSVKMPAQEQEIGCRLRSILANNLRDEVRELHTQLHEPARQQSLEAALEASSQRIKGWLAPEQSSPSQRAGRNEALVPLTAAPADLPEDQ